MKTETFKVYDDCWCVHKEGIAQIINKTTLVVMMEKPYYGLSWVQHFWLDGQEITREQFEGRAGFMLGRMYEHLMEVKRHYGAYKQILQKTEAHEKKVEILLQDAVANRDMAISDIDKMSNGLYIEALGQEVNHFYEKLAEENEVHPISYSNVKDYLRAIDLENKNNGKEQKG